MHQGGRLTGSPRVADELEVLEVLAPSDELLPKQGR